MVAPYIEKMTRSELMAIMVGGFSNTAGGVLGAYVMMLQGYFPDIAGHLITASLLSAPAAFIFAKVLVPETEEPLTRGEVKMDVKVQDANILDAVSSGTTVGWLAQRGLKEPYEAALMAQGKKRPASGFWLYDVASGKTEWFDKKDKPQAPGKGACLN